MKKEKELYRAISDKHIKVVSFDVFDTLILRPFLQPVDLFLFLDREISTTLEIPDVVDFSTCRREAECFVRKEKQTIGEEDVTLEEIYHYISERYPFPVDLIYKMMEQEIDLEKRYCYIRQFGVKLFRYALKQKKRVILTSDMYLPSDIIRSILEKNDIKGFERIFVSCETRKTKSSGRMYTHVAKELNVSANNILHIGDSLKSDVAVPRKKGWKALPLYKPADMLENKVRTIRTGDAFWHAFKNMRSSQPSSQALDYLGIRCMLAVVANRVFDNPFSVHIPKGDYNGSIELFGNLALGMYCLAQGLWVVKTAKEEKSDKVLFFSRDGWLPYQVYNIFNRFISLPEASYMHISRKAIYPLLFTSDERFLCSGGHIRYENHTPASLVRILMPVLDEKTIDFFRQDQSEKWDEPFSSELSLLRFLKEIREKCIDQGKYNAYQLGFQQYFAPHMHGQIITYDIGYSLRNESILKSFFPEAGITACFMHTSNDLPIRRSLQSEVKVRTFLNTSPYVSWLIRECFLTADEPSCIGYTSPGQPIYEEKKVQPLQIQAFQQEAMEYAKDFINIFQEDTLWLPLELADACLPFETFLHSPCRADRKWMGNLNAENEADSGKKAFEVLVFWKKRRTEYKIANQHMSRLGRHCMRFAMLFTTDKEELRQLIHKRLK